MNRFQTPAQMRAALEPFVGRGVNLTVLAEASATTQVVPTQAHLDQLYTAARSAFAERAWSRAMELLEAIVAADLTFRDAAALLADVRRRLALDVLYGEARELHRAHAWQAVLDHLNRIRRWTPTTVTPRRWGQPPARRLSSAANGGPGSAGLRHRNGRRDDSPRASTRTIGRDEHRTATDRVDGRSGASYGRPTTRGSRSIDRSAWATHRSPDLGGCGGGAGWWCWL